MSAALAGLVTGFSLIVAIGAQNAYVLRLGLARRHVGVAVLICATSDVVLIFLGVAGVGAVIRAVPSALDVLRWVGVLYLLAYGLHSFARAIRPAVLLPSGVGDPSTRVVVATTLAFTFLNPHVYLDTVLFLGSIGNQYGGDRWLFATGACVASIAWFTGLGFGSRAAAPLMARPTTWRILDTSIGIVMILVAVSVARTHISA